MVVDDRPGFGLVGAEEPEIAIHVFASAITHGPDPPRRDDTRTGVDPYGTAEGYRLVLMRRVHLGRIDQGKIEVAIGTRDARDGGDPAAGQGHLGEARQCCTAHRRPRPVSVGDAAGIWQNDLGNGIGITHRCG